MKHETETILTRGPKSPQRICRLRLVINRWSLLELCALELRSWEYSYRNR